MENVILNELFEEDMNWNVTETAVNEIVEGVRIIPLRTQSTYNQNYMVNDVLNYSSEFITLTFLYFDAG